MIGAKLGADIFLVVAKCVNRGVRGLLEDTAGRFQCLTGVEAVLVEPQETLGQASRLRTRREEAVEEFSLVLHKIYRWVSLAIETRNEDVVKRKNIIAILKHEREQALNADQERTKKREDELAADQAVSNFP